MRRLFYRATAKRTLHFFRVFSKQKLQTVLGIESSCDETGAAVVDENGKILGEALSSQMEVHLENGGVIPHLAKYYHEECINDVVTKALEQSGMTITDISAFAATSKPGLRSSLGVGLEKGKLLAKQASKPFIPIHHMEAHALTARMVEDVQFPFLVLLASGGHCQIALVEDVEKFYLLGSSFHNSPGEVLDKIARRLKLRNLPEYSQMSGGQAIDCMAKGGDPTKFNVPCSLLQYRDCNFSFAGYFSFAYQTINFEEIKYDVPADGVIPTAKDFCASLLHGYALHFSHRIERALLFCTHTNLISFDNPTLVFSGGVACNKYIRNILIEFCKSLNCRFVCPPPKLCTDNGIMIAWNGMERLKANVGLYTEFDDIIPESKCPLGIDIRKTVEQASIKIQHSHFFKVSS